MFSSLTDVGVMQLKRGIIFTIFILFLLLFFMVNSTAEEEIENLVEATFNIKFVTATDLVVNISIVAQHLTMAGETFNADQIKNANEQDLGSFRLLLFQMLETQIENTFKNTRIQNFSRPVFDGNFFNEELNVTLTSSYFVSIIPSRFYLKI